MTKHTTVKCLMLNRCLTNLTHNNWELGSRGREEVKCWISVAADNNFIRVSVDAKPSCVFSGEAENNINKSKPCGAADVFLVSLPATESWNWLSLQHLPNSQVCVATAEQKQSWDKTKQEAENGFSLLGAWIGWIVHLFFKPNVCPRGCEDCF